MSAWLPYAPVGALVLAYAALSLRAWRKRALKRRRTPAQMGADLEKHIAVGSIAGVAPSDISAHVLLVLEEDGKVTIEGTGCDSLRLVLLTSATAAFAQAAYRGHEHDEDGSPT